MKVRELIEQLVTADPDAVVVYLDSYADVYESDEIHEAFVDSYLWTHETGLRYGEWYDIRYPSGPEPVEGERHVIAAQKPEHVVVLSDGPTNLRYVTRYQVSQRQQELVNRGLRSHRWAQAINRYAPSRLVRRWSNENPNLSDRGRLAQRKRRRFLGVSKPSGRSLVTVPRAVRSTLRLKAGTRLCWYLSGDGFVSLRTGPTHLRNGTTP
ncbi:hypothetical protein OKW38_002840 [Paraburkholderia sp. MM5496-R1]